MRPAVPGWNPDWIEYPYLDPSPARSMSSRHDRDRLSGGSCGESVTIMECPVACPARHAISVMRIMRAGLDAAGQGHFLIVGRSATAGCSHPSHDHGHGKTSVTDVAGGGDGAAVPRLATAGHRVGRMATESGPHRTCRAAAPGQPGAAKAITPGAPRTVRPGVARAVRPGGCCPAVRMRRRTGGPRRTRRGPGRRRAQRWRTARMRRHPARTGCRRPARRACCAR
jgi:hypothetical protein